MFKRVSAWVFLLIFLTGAPSFSELMPISGDWQQQRFLFSGNWQGRLTDLQDPENPQPAPVWKTLTLLDELKRQHPETITISVGNIFSNQSPSSLLLNGEMEESLERLCRFDAITLGPLDFSLIKSWKHLPDHLFDRIWTNVIPAQGMRTFAGHKIIRKNGMTLGIGGLISRESLTDSPLFNLSGYQVEDPARALRRIRLEAGNVDLMIVVCHMNRQNLRELMSMADGKTRFVLVPTEPLKERELQRLLTNKTAHAWLMPDGTRQLLSGHIEKRLGGRTEESLHRLSIEGYAQPGRFRQTAASFPAFPIMASGLKKIWFHPIRLVIPPEVSAETPFSFRSAVHAKMARSFTRSDAAIIRLSPEPLQNEQVITCGRLIQTIEPDFLRTYVFSGPKLLTLLNLFAGRARAKASIGVSGFSMTFSGNMLTGCKIRGKSIDENSEFRVTLNSHIYQDPILADLFANGRQVGDCGKTMWDAWLQELPSLPLTTRITQKEN